MNGYETYKMYHSIMLHFKTKGYDYFKYHGQSKVNETSWLKRNDKYHFEKLGAENPYKRLMEIFVSFFVENPDSSPAFSKELYEHKKKGYLKWKSRINSLERIFDKDMKFLYKKTNGNLKSAFKSNNDHPLIIKLLIDKKISLETIIVLDKLTNIIKKLDDKYHDDFIWDTYSELLKSYKPFIVITEKEKYLKIAKKYLTN